MQSNNIPSSGFSWYTVNSQQTDPATTFGPATSIPIQQPNSQANNSQSMNPSTTFGPATSIPIQQTDSQANNRGYEIMVDNGNGRSVPQVFNENTPVTINAQNVYINEINEDGHHSLLKNLNPTTQTGAQTAEKKTEVSKSGDGTTQTAKSTSVVSSDGQQAKSITTETPQSTDTIKKTETTTNNNPAVVPVPTNNTAPNGAVQPSTAPGATTTTKDGIHTTPLSGTPASDKNDTKAPLSTSNPAPTLPANSDHPAEPSNNKKKDNKPHKGIKEKFHDWRANRKSGGTPANADVHPKDSRDGKILPSEAELGKYMDLGGESALDKEGSGLPKDKLDATGKSVTGSDANPSKASNPFNAPTPAMKQAPVEAKAQ